MKQYKELVTNILNNGQRRTNRTGVDTFSVFGTQTRYNIQEGFPLLTTKKVNFKAVVAELLWFLKGSTNINDLDSKIWDEWADKNGELGPVYGFQWRHWGGDHQLGTADDLGVDQIAAAIDTIKNNPDSRRIIVSAWNPTDTPDMALPPCHLMFQFNVRNSKYLDCQMYQRSADVALGVPFNIASYALLTRLIANECKLLAGELIHTIGDAHVYINHVEGLLEQLERRVRPLPEVIIPVGKPVDEITADDIKLEEYRPHPAIKFKVAV